MFPQRLKSYLIAPEILRLPIDNLRFDLGLSSVPKAKEHDGSNTMASIGSALMAACNHLIKSLPETAGHSLDNDINIRKQLAMADMLKLKKQ
jgi:CO/xanthine dehydrogenase Mo-binding subunit